MRLAVSWQDSGSLADAVRDVLPLPVEASAAAPVETMELSVRPPLRTPRGASSASRPLRESPPAGMSFPTPADAAIPATAATSLAPVPSPLIGSLSSPSEIVPPASALPSKPVTRTSAPSRLSVSSWMIARSGVGAGSSAFAPQLGGTQGGIRVDYALAKGFAATARLAAPAAGAGREVSLGIAWRPANVPVRLVVEQRIALDAGRGGPSVGVSGGIDTVRLPVGFRLEGYGQAGIIVRDGVEHFVDGSARATRPLLAIGGIGLDAGMGAWGGAQRGVARLDVGPTVGARVPVFGQRVRLAVDWRQRIAGHARPGSGPALTMGMDF